MTTLPATIKTLEEFPLFLITVIMAATIDGVCLKEKSQLIFARSLSSDCTTVLRLKKYKCIMCTIFYYFLNFFVKNLFFLVEIFFVEILFSCCYEFPPLNALETNTVIPIGISTQIKQFIESKRKKIYFCSFFSLAQCFKFDIRLSKGKLSHLCVGKSYNV